MLGDNPREYGIAAAEALEQFLPKVFLVKVAADDDLVVVRCTVFVIAVCSRQSGRGEGGGHPRSVLGFLQR